MTYSYAQLEGLWTQAGGDPSKASVMAAIAMAESGGDPSAVNNNTNGTTDRGLWQINSIWGSLSTFDPTANAKAAVQVYNQQGITAWSTYNNGAYLKFTGGQSSPASGGTGDAASASGGANAQSTDWLGNLFGWFTGIGPLEGTGGSGSLTGALGSGLEQGLFNAFWDIFKKIFDTLMKPIFWLIEVNWGVMLMLAGLVILLAGTRAGQMGTSLLAAVPGPIGFVGKGAAALGGVRGVRSSRQAPAVGPTSAERTTAELERRSDRAASRKLMAPHRSKTYYSSGPDQNRAVRTTL